jgi:hypothetical protein
VTKEHLQNRLGIAVTKVRRMGGDLYLRYCSTISVK